MVGAKKFCTKQTIDAYQDTCSVTKPLLLVDSSCQALTVLAADTSSVQA
jgi:hypothetical protein